MSEELTITLERGPNGLGFNIKGGIDEPMSGSENKVCVSLIKETGSAAADGRLKVGDIILAVNGQSFEGLKHEEAAEIFKTAGDSLTIAVLRRPKKKNEDEEATKKILIGLTVLAVVVGTAFILYKRRR